MPARCHRAAPIVGATCQKQAYASKAYAKRVASEHAFQFDGPCLKCARGARMRAYRCDAGPHYHVGHIWPVHYRGER